MSIFPPSVPTWGTCPYCDGACRVPPGVYYDGEPHHRQCADILREQQFTDQVAQPAFDRLEEALNEAIDVDTAASCWDL